MFGSGMLDVAIGMIFVYLLLSLICTAAKELIEARMKHRATDLEAGIRNLLADPATANEFYKHPLIKALYLKDKGKPSYIPSRTFAITLLNIVAPPDPATGVVGANPIDNIRAQVSKLPADNQLRKALLALIEDSQGDIDKLRENVEHWFDATMDRVSGWYKRRSHVIVFFLGLAITVIMNADSITIANSLSHDTSLRSALVGAAQEYAKANAATPAQSPAPAASPAPASTPNVAPGASPSPAQPQTDARRSSRAHASAANAANTASNSTATQPATTNAANTTITSNANTNTSTTRAATAAASPTPEIEACVKDPYSRECACKKDANSPECRVQSALGEIKTLGLPIGWVFDDTRAIPYYPPGAEYRAGRYIVAWLLKLIGWLLTAAAISLGAPFWFDMLNKFMVIRSTVKPHEKSPEEASEDRQEPENPSRTGQPSGGGTTTASTAGAANEPVFFLPQEWSAGDPQEGVL